MAVRRLVDYGKIHVAIFALSANDVNWNLLRCSGKPAMGYEDPTEENHLGNILFASDHHLFHANTFEKFKTDDGSPMRPFRDLSEMHECIIANHNRVVNPGDKVYFLGDVSMRYGQELSQILSRMNGKRRLLLGNHDRMKGTNLVNLFEKVELWRVFGEYGFICTHVPLHPAQMRRAILNVHGHIHANDMNDNRYMNVSVEAIDYTPVPLEKVLARVEKLRRENTPAT